MAFNSLSSAIEEIKLRSNIVDVINAVVPLKKTGSNYKACCPFHREKTPSFIVSEDKQIFTCFGCGATGDAIEFVKKYYNLQFPDAVRKLANQYGVEIADSYARQGQKRAPYYAANRMAARFFFDALTGKANPGYSYMKGRGFEDKTLVQFGIGYSDENWQSLTDYMKAAGISEEMLTELGLSSRQERRASLYDYFRGRVMFPIINTVGNVVGFGGRVLGDGVPKYLNSRESIVFEKKRNLYGLNLTKGDIREKGFAVLVEGYLDVMSLYQAGVRNVVATLGTALTSEQAKLLTKYTKKVILCYDADSAGVNAALRGIDVLREEGADVRVLHVDDGKDPDDYIKKHSAEEFYALIDKKSVPDVEYKIKLIRVKYDTGDITQGVKFLKACAQVLRKLSPVEADLYIRKIADDYGVSEGALRREVGRDEAREQSGKPAGSDAAASLRHNPGDEAAILLEKTLLKLCLQQSKFWPRAAQREDAFVSEGGFEIAAAMNELYEEDSIFRMDDLKERLSEEAAAYLESIDEDVLVGYSEEQAFEDCMDTLDRRRGEKRIKEIKDILSIAKEEESEKLEALIAELFELQKKYIK